MPSDLKIGFIGQGFVGKHMADDFEHRGFAVVRYAKEPQYQGSKAEIKTCDVVFIAVPTPTTPNGFDATILKEVLNLVGENKIAVIKSTILPGTTVVLQKLFPGITLLHSPEFLREKFAGEDARHPTRTIIGIPHENEMYFTQAQFLLSILPKAQYEKICHATEAELIKYGGNCFLALKVVFMNMLYEAATHMGVDYEVVAKAMAADSRIGGSHMQVVDDIDNTGRGAGGHCFPKDLAAFTKWYRDFCASDVSGVSLWDAFEKKNIDLLKTSNKDIVILKAIYGD